MRVYTVYGDQDEIARELGMTRQALAIHLKRLKELGLVRTGREFVDITEKAVKLLKGQSNDVIILVKIEPKYRDKVYEATKKLPIEKALRLAGDYDLAIITQETVLDKVLDSVNNMEGVKETKTFISIGAVQDEIARELGMTRQALAIHLKRLKELGLVRTGREFVDITEKAVRLLKGQSSDVIILVKIEPKYRDKVYDATKKLPVEKALRLAGDYDLAIITQETVLDKVLDSVNNMEGVKETKTLISIGAVKE
jgi:DNA-binding Lrp family transcriptional regulator